MTTIASTKPMDVLQHAPGRRVDAAADLRAREADTATKADAGSGEVLSQEERQFFARLYPEDTKTISMHSTYSRSGLAKAGAVVGSLIDKKS